MILDAYDGYVLGRPKIDEIEIRFIPDPNATVADLLTGDVDLTLGRSLLTVEQVQSVQAQWRAAKLAASLRVVGPGTRTVHQHQSRGHYRRAVPSALIQAIDRQQMLDTFMGGQSSITHTFVAPDSAEFKEIESSVVRYDYDPRRSIQMIEGIWLHQRHGWNLCKIRRPALGGADANDHSQRDQPEDAALGG